MFPCLTRPLATPLRRAARGLAPLFAAAGLCAAAAALAQQTPPQRAVVEVQPGDTFSAITARYIGNAGQWRTMYRPHASRLPNPNVIVPGMRFEVVADKSGARYLRLLGGEGAAVAPAAPARTAAAATAQPATGAQPTPAAPVRTPVARAAAEPAPAAPAASGRDDDTLVVGVLPNIAADKLGSQYERLRRYLERVEGRKVRIVVPAGFKAFFDATMRGEYDLAVAAPNLARVAQQERKMQPIAMYEPRINALFVAPIDTKLAGPKDVRERAVAFANPTSLVALYGQQWLRGAGLEAGRDYEVKGARTDLGVGRMLLTGDAVAAIMSNGEFRALPPEESARLKVVDVFARIPNFVLLAHPRLQGERAGLLKARLKSFFADKEDGEPFAQATGFSAVVDVDEAAMRELDAFAPATRRAMGYEPTP